MRLSTNHFRLTSRPQWALYQYHVDYNPLMEARRLRSALLFQHEDLIGRCHAFDGTILFLPKRLQHKVIPNVGMGRGGGARGSHPIVQLPVSGPPENPERPRCVSLTPAPGPAGHETADAARPLPSETLCSLVRTCCARPWCRWAASRRQGSFSRNHSQLASPCPHQVTEVFSQTRNGEHVKITITLTNELPPTSPTCLQFYNIIFRRFVSVSYPH